MNEIAILIRLRDQVSAPLRSIQASVGQLQKSVSGARQLPLWYRP